MAASFLAGSAAASSGTAACPGRRLWSSRTSVPTSGLLLSSQLSTLKSQRRFVSLQTFLAMGRGTPREVSPPDAYGFVARFSSGIYGSFERFHTPQSSRGQEDS
eukprot:3625811-Pyramimonas_sp.AAC.2